MQAALAVATPAPVAGSIAASARPNASGATAAATTLAGFLDQLAAALAGSGPASGGASEPVPVQSDGATARATDHPVALAATELPDPTAAAPEAPDVTGAGQPAGGRSHSVAPARRGASAIASVVPAAAHQPAAVLLPAVSGPALTAATPTAVPEAAKAPAGRPRAMSAEAVAAGSAPPTPVGPALMAPKPAELAACDTTASLAQAAHADPGSPGGGAATNTDAITSVPPALPSPVSETVRPAADPAPTATPAPTAHAGATPAAQVARALVSVAPTADGAQRLTLRLDPPELGQVHVRIERMPDASTRVDVTVQRPETLTLLLRDQPQLQRALDQAGVPADGRTVTMQTMPPTPANHSNTAAIANTASATPGQAWGDGSHPSYRQGSGPTQSDAAPADDGDAAFQPIAVSTWLRAGIDITA